MIDKFSSFEQRVRTRAHAVHSWLCIGIDPHLASLPSHLPNSADGVLQFCREVIDSTCDLACSFKINFAYFEALGIDGWSALTDVRRAISDDIPVIADAKRGDIASSADAYARSIFDVLEFDAVTVSPYLGWDALHPFTSRVGKGVFVLCKTSNPGASDLQDLNVSGRPLYLHVASEALHQSCAGDIGLVVGATQPEALAAVRTLDEDVLLLAPGAGTQGGDAVQAFALASNREGDNAILPVSREILFASPYEDFADAARRVASRRARQLWQGAV